MKNTLLFTVLIFFSTVLNTLYAQESIGISNTSISTKAPPIYIIDGKEVDSFKANDLKTDEIKSMSVLKGDDAINRYGAKGKNGVIEIITKNAITKKTTVISLKSNSSIDREPLYIYDGKEIKKGDVKDANDIESMTVIKGKEAVDKYGERGKDGVIVIISKNAPLEITSKPKSEIRLNSKGLGILDPIYVLDGVEISKSDMEKVDSDSIEKMSVLKGDKAIDKYGDKAKNGVVEIFSKK